MQVDGILMLPDINFDTTELSRKNWPSCFLQNGKSPILNENMWVTQKNGLWKKHFQFNSPWSTLKSSVSHSGGEDPIRMMPPCSR